ncbi:MAG TPA: class I SAM-dependent methyltransferase [Solirubrobacteraceae bacterium]|jgi:SAM-dependent methyltransferase|nr:class I SAM-dependent methyltransferase [Solirubrobacteraceae bacterium]
MGHRFDRDSWERRWSDALRDGAHAVAQRPPNAHLLAETADLRPGVALDAGAGHGAETLWLAERGWRVTAVDFSATALAHAQANAERIGADTAERIEWIEADLGTWAPPPRRYDLIISLYVHVAGSVEGFAHRLAAGVALGGTLVLVGHRPVDPSTGAPTPAAGQVQISVEDAVAALDPAQWDVLTAEERPRQAGGTGVDAVIRARRLAP